MGALSGFAATYFSTACSLGSSHPAVEGCWPSSMVSSPSPFELIRWSVVLPDNPRHRAFKFLGRSIIGRVGERFVPFPFPFFERSLSSVLSFLTRRRSFISAISWFPRMVLPLSDPSWFESPISGRESCRSRHGRNSCDETPLPLDDLRRMLAGLGAPISPSLYPGWKENMTSGQGWIAIAMVIFALWNP